MEKDWSRALSGLSVDEALRAIGVGSIEEWVGRWSEVAEGRAWLADRDQFVHSVGEVRRYLEPHRGEILAEAEAVMRHEIRGWGEVVIRHGPTVDFNAAYGESGLYGFHYWFWARPLVQAYLLTGEERYLDEFERLFNQWFEQRGRVAPTLGHLHPVWNELGLGLRCRAFLEFYCLRPDCGRETHERMLVTLLATARWLAVEQQERGYRPGNWQIMGCYGLALVGTVMREFREAENWRSIAEGMLRRHAEEDFFPDGCHSERVISSYSLVAYRDFRNVAQLMEEGRAFFEEQLGRQRGFLMSVVGRDGYFSGVNDGERARAPGVLLEDGQKNGEQARRLHEESVHYPASGFTVLRNGGVEVLVNHGPYGGGHSHADALSFQVHGAGGGPVAIDAGIGRTYDDPLHGPWYTRAVAHNMVTVDGADPERREAAGVDVAFSHRDGVAFWAATHRGYEASHGVRHRRHVAVLSDGCVVVYDRVEMTATGPRRVMFHLHVLDEASVRVVRGDGGWVKRSDRGWASVRGIEGFGGKTHAEIPHLTFGREAAGPGMAHLGVTIWTGEGEVSFTGAEGRYTLVRGGQVRRIVFSPGGVEVTRLEAT